MIAALAVLMTVQSGVKLHAATAMVNGKPEVRLRWQIPEGWIPPQGLRLYRVVGTTRTLVKAIPAPTDSAVDGLLGAKFKGRKLATAAATALPPGTRLNFAIVRPPSSLNQFNLRKAAAGVKPLAPGSSLRAGGAPAAGVSRPAATTGGRPAAAANPVRTTPPASLQRPAALRARTDLHLAALVDSRNAETLGLGASDPGVSAGATVGYSLVAAQAGGRDGAVLGTLSSFRVGSDAPPPSPAGLMFFQEEEELHLRWTRPTPAEETRLLAASYRTYRAANAAETGVLLTPKPLLIMDIDGKEPASFFVDELARPGVFTYRVVLIDGFGRASPPAALNVPTQEWRRPDPPSKATVGPGAAFLNAFRSNTRGEGRITPLAARQGPPPVVPTIAWRSSPPQDGMAVKYAVYRYSLDQPNAPAAKLTPSPIDGAIMPTQTEEQLEAAIDATYGPAYLDDLEARIQLIANRPATTAEARADRTKDVAKARARLAAIKKSIGAAFQSLPPRQFIDSAAPRDGKYAYSLTAQFAPLGLESPEAMAGAIDVPDYTPPPAVVAGPPTFTPAPAPAKTFAKSPAKSLRPGFVSDQIKARAATPKGPMPRAGKPANSKSPLSLHRLPLKLNLPPSDFGGSLDLKWTGLNLRGVRYRIRRKSGTEPFAEVALTPPGATSFRDRLPRSRARTYDYEIRAISRWNVLGAVANFSAPVPATVVPDVPNVLSAAVGDADGEILVRVEAAAPEQGVVKYRFFRDNRAGGEVPASAAQQGVIVFRDPGRAPGAKHAYSVEGETGAGLKSPRSPAFSASAVKTSAAPPTGLTATSGPTGVVLRWTAAPGSVGYLVRRKIGTGVPVVLAPRVAAATFTDVHAMRGRTYVYEVLAIDAQGNVSPAATVTAVVP